MATKTGFRIKAIQFVVEKKDKLMDDMFWLRKIEKLKTITLNIEEKKSFKKSSLIIQDSHILYLSKQSSEAREENDITSLLKKVDSNLLFGQNRSSILTNFTRNVFSHRTSRHSKFFPKSYSIF